MEEKFLIKLLKMTKEQVNILEKLLLVEEMITRVLVA